MDEYFAIVWSILYINTYLLLAKNDIPRRERKTHRSDNPKKNELQSFPEEGSFLKTDCFPQFLSVLCRANQC